MAVAEQEVAEVAAGPTSVVVQAENLLWALKLVEHATGKDEDRPLLTYVVLRARDDALWVIAADNYRIAEARIPLPEPTPFPDVLIGPDDRGTLRAFLARKTTPALLRVDRDTLTVSCRRASVTVVLGIGKFPDTDQVAAALPANPFHVRFNAKFLADAAKAMGDDVVRIAFGSPTQPAVFTIDAEDTAYRETLMPVRAAEDSAQ